MSYEVPRGRVLIISDDGARADRLCRWAKTAGENATPVFGEDALEFDRTRDEPIDLVVTDMDSDTPETVKLLRQILDEQLFAGVPQLHALRDSAVLARLRQVNAHAAALSMSSPPEPEEFKTRVRMGAEIGRLRRALSEAAIRDELTGTANRSFLMMRMDQEMARARRYGTPLSVVLFSIDQLRSINETYGTAVGDQAIHEIAGVLTSQVRREDVCGRLGAKVFAAILPGSEHRGAAIFANKVRGDSEEFFVEADGVKIPVRISAGISSYREHEGLRRGADLIRAAEEALIEAKRRGGNRVFIDETVVRAERRVVLIADKDPEWLDLAEDLLALDDYRVIRAESTSTLFETLRYRSPDVLILDTQLDDDTGDLIQQIRNIDRDVSIPIIGTGSPAAPGFEPSFHPAVDRFLTKPFSVSVLRTLTRELLQCSSASRPRAVVV